MGQGHKPWSQTAQLCRSPLCVLGQVTKTCLCPSFLIYKMGIIAASASQGCEELDEKVPRMDSYSVLEQSRCRW